MLWLDWSEVKVIRTWPRTAAVFRPVRRCPAKSNGGDGLGPKVVNSSPNGNSALSNPFIFSKKTTFFACNNLKLNDLTSMASFYKNRYILLKNNDLAQWLRLGSFFRNQPLSPTIFPARSFYFSVILLKQRHLTSHKAGGLKLLSLWRPTGMPSGCFTIEYLP